MSRPDRWVFAFPAPGPADLDGALRAATGADVALDVQHVSRTTYAVELAERFRERSAFLIGDAAHRLTPRGATGMNTAIRDGYDLGWKLAWVLRGWAGEDLSTATRPSGGRSPSTTAPAGPTPTAPSAASPRSCTSTSAAASPTPGCRASHGPPARRHHRPRARDPQRRGAAGAARRGAVQPGLTSSATS
jgi:hypothetical protein